MVKKTSERVSNKRRLYQQAFNYPTELQVSWQECYIVVDTEKAKLSKIHITQTNYKECYGLTIILDGESFSIPSTIIRVRKDSTLH